MKLYLNMNVEVLVLLFLYKTHLNKPIRAFTSNTVDTNSCFHRTITLDERFYKAHHSVKILDAKWHPGSLADVQIIVLTSDNKLRYLCVAVHCKLNLSFPFLVFSF